MAEHWTVKSLDDIPSDFVGREIYMVKNQRFVSKGKMPEAVVKMWTEIWQKKKKRYKEPTVPMLLSR